MTESRPTSLLAVAIVLALVASGIPLLPTGTSTAHTLDVCGTGCDHATLQAAIDAAQPGDTIRVHPGTYEEALVVPAGKTGLTLCAADDTPGCATAPTTRPRIDARGLGAPALTLGGAGTIVSDLAFVANDAGPDGAVIRLTADDLTLSGLTVRTTGSTATGIDGQNARSGITLRGNDIAPLGNETTVAEDGIRGRFYDSLIEGNTVRGYATGVRLRPYGDDTTIQHNRFSLLNTGIALWSPNTYIAHNTFQTVNMGIDIAEAAGTSGAGTLLRENDLTLTLTPLRVRADGLAVDARLNDWGVHALELITARNDDTGTGNTVLVTPFLANGAPEPGLPLALPASHSGTPAVCDAHPDAEYVAGHCRYLTLQAALDLAHPGSTVYVPASTLATPYPEALTIQTNDLGTPLDGLTLCASLGGAICASDITPGHWQTHQDRDSTRWATPPVVRSGDALRIDLSAAPGHGSTSWFPDTSLQIEDLGRLAWDQYLESGSCSAGSPRIGLGIDTTGDGQRDATIAITSASLTASCTTGTWRHVALLDRPDVSWHSTSVGGPSAGQQADAHQAAEAAANANGVSHRVVAVNLIHDAGTGTMWFDNQIVDTAFLGGPLDETCVLSADIACRQALATAHTIIDGTGHAAVLQIAADDVTIDGLTLRHSGAPVQDTAGIRLDAAARPQITANRIHLEGGGCGFDPTSGAACYSHRVDGITGTSQDAVITDNLIAADLVSLDARAIGGTDGIRGTHPGALIANNTLRAWLGGGMVLGGQDLRIESNSVRGTTTALLLFGSAHGAEVTKNEILVSEQAISVSSGTPTGLRINDNHLGLTNGVGLEVRDSAGPVAADLSCNDWGVYHGALIRETRIQQDNDPFVNLLQTDPYTVPDGSGGTRCLIAPEALIDTAATTVARNTTLRFKDSSSAGDTPIIARHWDFGDGHTSIFSNPRHTYSDFGTYAVTLRVWDLQGMTSSTTTTIDVVNLAPVLSITGLTTVTEGEGLQLGIVATDPEGDHPITLAASGLPTGAVFSPSSVSAILDWTPALGAAGTYPVDITATDNLGATTTETLLLTVLPYVPATLRLAPIPKVTLVQTGGNADTPIEASAEDPSLITLSADGLPSWATFIDAGNGNGRIVWSPPVGTTGTFTVTILADDGTTVTSRTFVVDIVPYTKVALGRGGDTPLQTGSPGSATTLQVALQHVQGVDAEVALAMILPTGWTATYPALVQVPAGETVLIQVQVDPAETLRFNRVILQTILVGAYGPQETLEWSITTPVRLSVGFDDTPSVTQGVRGTVRATFDDGSPVVGRTVTFERWSALSPALRPTTVSGMTDADGVFTFDLQTTPTARLLGEHGYSASLDYARWTWEKTGSYRVETF